MDQPPQINQEEPEICKKALRQIAELADGNGIKATEVRLATSEENIFDIPAKLEVTILSEISEKKINGRSVSGRELGSLAELTKAVEDAKNNALDDGTTQQSIIQRLEQEPGSGWGIDAKKYNLEEIAEDFSYAEACGPCQGSGKFPCNACQGIGTASCKFCQGQGRTHCLECRGEMRIRGADGQEIICPRCHGEGLMVCHECNGNRSVVCEFCNGSQVESCAECGATGWHSTLIHVHLEALTSFSLVTDDLPGDLVTTLKDIDLVSFAKEGLGKIECQGHEKPEDGPMIIHYTAHAPFGHIEVSINGTPFTAKVIGYPGKVIGIEPFLDHLLKPGIAALSKATKGGLASGALFEKASKYKALREVLSGLGAHSKKWVYKKLQKTYPIGLSDKYAKAAVKFADQALKYATLKPRYIGLGGGFAASLFVFLAYFVSNVRQSIDAQNLMFTDIAILALAITGSIYGIKFAAAKGLKKILPNKLQTTEQKGLPSAGEQGIWAFIGIIVLYVIAIEIAGITGADIPTWWAGIKSRF